MNSLFDSEIKQILQKNHIKINGIVPKDKLPKPLKNGWYIINLENSNEGGSHWTCFKYINGNIAYIDSFGICSPIEVLEKVKKNCSLEYSTVDTQELDSTACGWFCISAIIYDGNNKAKPFDYKGFLSHFDLKNTKNNDLRLKTLLTKLKVF